MPFVKNSVGRISEVDAEEEAKWLGQPGFSSPRKDEVDDYLFERKEKIENIKAQRELADNSHGTDGVYMITVSQGGKDGYGVASAKLFKELQSLGVKILMENEGQKIAFLFHNPYSITRLESPIRILFTMFESSKLPDDWRDYLEEADKIIVPSHWNQKIFREFGFNADVIPLGFDSDIFKFIERTPKRPERKDFVFLHYNAFNIRKGFSEVFKAFTKAFEPTEPVRLVLKTTLPQAPLPIAPSVYPNIDVITGSVSDEELLKILGNADCFLFPSRGEGFGMTPLEAMATGLPTIVPNAHGISEYFNEAFMYEVKVKEECPALYSRYKGQDVGKMVICDVDDLARQMRYIYEHEEESLAKGRAASFYVQQWTYKETAKKLAALFAEMNKRPEADRPLKNILNMEPFR